MPGTRRASWPDERRHRSAPARWVGRASVAASAATRGCRPRGGATSTSFRLSSARAHGADSKAVDSSIEWRSMRMPFARSVTARRPKAPSRSWYSVKRRNTMSIGALPVLRIGVVDVGEDAALGCLPDEVGIGRVDEGDHGAGGLVHDLLDQLERMLGALAKANEGDVRPFPRRHCSDVLHLDLARDHLVPESGDDLRDDRQAIRALVRDQHAQMLGLTMTHPPPDRRV